MWKAKCWVSTDKTLNLKGTYQHWLNSKRLSLAFWDALKLITMTLMHSLQSCILQNCRVMVAMSRGIEERHWRWKAKCWVSTNKTPNPEEEYVSTLNLTISPAHLHSKMAYESLQSYQWTQCYKVAFSETFRLWWQCPTSRIGERNYRWIAKC